MGARGSCLQHLVAGVFFAAALVPVVPARAQQPPLQAVVEPMLYAVSVNGRPRGESVLLKVDGRLLARVSDWERWHLVLPPQQYLYEGEAYHDLAQAPGFVARFDAGRQVAELEFSPRAFRPSTLNASPRRFVTAQPPDRFGSYLNYELFGTHRVPDGGDAASNLDGLVEIGAFGPGGVATSEWLGRNLTDEEIPAFSGERKVVRLETAYQQDDPQGMSTLRLGDSIGDAGLWGRPIRFGGTLYARNFSTQPGFVAQPQPALAGETAVPSVLDIYVDGLRRQSLEVPPGPFAIENLPTVTGQGEVQVVVRDLLGREVVISDTYITGVQLLRAGLHDYSYEAGFLRERFAIDSDEYGDPFAAGTHRYGFSDQLTGEARVEVGPDAATAGLGGVLAIPGIAIVSNAFAVSHSDRGSGALDVLTVQHLQRRGVSLGARLQVASRDFVQLGAASRFPVPQRSFSANAGYAWRPVGRFGLGYVNRDQAAPEPDFEAITANFTRTIRRVSLTLLAIDRKRPSHEYSVGASLSVPFGTRESASAGHRVRRPDGGAESTQSYARLQRNLSEQEGWGYRLRVNHEEDAAGNGRTGAEAGVGVNARHGSYALEAATVEEAETFRATVSGAVGSFAGHGFATRKLSRSFAIVEAGASDVELRVNNRVAGRTDAEGVAVLPYLHPYQDNVVSINLSELPLDVEVHSGEFRAAPYFRSGVRVPLDVRRTRSALLTLRQADGSPVPAGAFVRLADGTEAVVGRDGRAFLTGLKAGDNVLEVRWNGNHRCGARLTLPADAGIQPDLGLHTCQ